ncbi:hypothetical protein TanjilG_28698 [Lupinus angustifolius]|uniref:Uncharacterized protein n=1 Tax=Lupinus angustifolius TaxID=3871 RepID=A0A1J7FZH4_LUPAN|nr:hypothetical protein TanjilG_28698 [Lupinus angustifolius]
MSVHPVPRWMGPHYIFTRVVKKGICRGPDPVVVEVDRMIAEFWARREARARRSGRTIEEFDDLEDEDEEDMAISNAMWYSIDVVVLVLEHVVTPLVEEHRAREEPMPYPPVIVIDSETEMEEDPSPDEPESLDSWVA